MPDQPLNPDALASLIMWTKLPFGGRPDSYISLDANAAHAVIEILKPHLAHTQPVTQKLTDAEWREFQAIPDQGYSHREWVDARIAERVAHAQPVVSTLEELDKLPAGSIVGTDGREFYKTSRYEYPWMLSYGVETFGSIYLANQPRVTVLYTPEGDKK